MIFLFLPNDIVYFIYKIPFFIFSCMTEAMCSHSGVQSSWPGWSKCTCNRDKLSLRTRMTSLSVCGMTSSRYLIMVWIWVSITIMWGVQARQKKTDVLFNSVRFNYDIQFTSIQFSHYSFHLFTITPSQSKTKGPTS